jgi:hypothetical protein
LKKSVGPISNFLPARSILSCHVISCQEKGEWGRNWTETRQ